jgi:predicted DNA-binding ribbon-helix-helix protein
MNETNDKPEHLEEIRDIIFGPQKRDFEKRVQGLHAQIESTKAQFAQLIEELNTSFLNELRTMMHTLEERLKHGEERGNTSRLELMQHAQQMETRFTAAMQQAIHTSAERSASLNIQMKQLGEAFNKELLQHDERREASVAQLLDRIRHEREDVIALLDAARRAAVEQSETFSQHLKQHEERMATNRAELMKHLEQTESRFERSVQNAIQTAAEKIGALDVKLNSAHKTLLHDIATLRAEMVSDLNKRTKELTDEKVSREAMAETLMELAKRIKGEERLKLVTQSKTTKS